MLILGIDPGSRHTGYGLVDSQGEKLEALAYGRISCPADLAVPQRLAHLACELESIVDNWQPQAAVLETPFHGLNSRSLVVLAEARGALLAVLAARGVEIREYTPAEVKSAVTGNGRADKGQVARMVQIILSMVGKKTSTDATDALAVAICFAHRRRQDDLVRRNTAS
jgi:crossover junction endodeoxyribonuclease RuvC